MTVAPTTGPGTAGGIARAHLELLKRDLEQRTSSVGVKAVDEHVKDKDTLSYALAHEAVARHDARLGQTAEESAETLEERLQRGRTAASWQDLLGQPTSGRRSGRRPAG